MTSMDLGNALFFQSMKALELTLGEVFSLQSREKRGSCHSLDGWDLPKMLAVLKTKKDLREEVFVSSTSSQSKLNKERISNIISLRNKQAHNGKYSMVDLSRCLTATQDLLQALKQPPKSMAVTYSLKISCTLMARLISNFGGKLNGRETVFFKTSPSNERKAFHSRLALSTTRLFGREEELKAITAVLKDVQASSGYCLLLLFGQHGVGKTALAREVLHCLQYDFPNQHFFQATTKESFRASSSLFLECRAKESGEEQARFQFCESELFHHLRKAHESLLLVVDDVTDPDVILGNFPEERHCIIFTSVNQKTWSQAKISLRNFFVSEVKCLSSNAALALFKHTLKRNGGTDKAAIVNSPEKAKEIQDVLEQDMRNIPLAVRLAGFYFLSAKPFGNKFSFSIELNKSARSREDVKAAGRVHVRGFHYLVRNAIESFQQDTLSMAVCCALSLLPSSGVPVWYLELLTMALLFPVRDACRVCRVKTVLLNSGLVTEEENNIFSMHVVVQEHVQSYLADFHFQYKQIILFGVCHTFNVMMDEFKGEIPVNTGTAARHLGTQGLYRYIAQITHFLANREVLSFDSNLEFCLRILQFEAMTYIGSSHSELKPVKARLQELTAMSTDHLRENVQDSDPSVKVKHWLITNLCDKVRKLSCNDLAVDVAGGRIRNASNQHVQIELLRHLYFFLPNNEWLLLFEKLDISYLFLMNEYVTTGSTDAIACLVQVCEARLVVENVDSAAKLARSIIMVVFSQNHCPLPKYNIHIGLLAQKIAMKLLLFGKLRQAFVWWEMFFSIYQVHPTAPLQAMCMLVCSTALATLSSIDSPQPNSRRLVWIFLWLKRLQHLETQLEFTGSQFVEIVVTLLTTAFLFLSRQIGKSAKLTTATGGVLLKFLLRSTALETTVPLHSLSTLLFWCAEMGKRHAFATLFLQFCKSLSKSSPSQKSAKMVFVAFMCLWPRGRAFQSCQALERLSAVLLCVVTEFHFKHGLLGDKIPFLLRLFVFSPVCTANVCTELTRLVALLKRRGDTVLADHENLMQRRRDLQEMMITVSFWPPTAGIHCSYDYDAQGNTRLEVSAFLPTKYGRVPNPARFPFPTIFDRIILI